MPIIEEQLRETPALWQTGDYANNGALRRIVGLRCLNNTTVPIRVRITQGAEGTELDWWTPLGRPDSIIAVGEEVSGSGFSVPASQTDSYSLSVGEA